MDLWTQIPQGIWPGYQRERGTYVLARATHHPSARRRGQRLLAIGGRLEQRASGSLDRAETTVITPNIAKRIWRRGEKASSKLARITAFGIGALAVAWLTGLGWLGAWTIYAIWVALYTRTYKLRPKKAGPTDDTSKAAPKRTVTVPGAPKKASVDPNDRIHRFGPPNWKLMAVIAAVVAAAGLAAGFTVDGIDPFWLLQLVVAPAGAAWLIRAYGWDTVVEMTKVAQRKAAPIKVGARKGADPGEEPLPQQITVRRARVAEVTETTESTTTIAIEVPEVELLESEPAAVQTIRRRVYIDDDPGELSGPVDLDSDAQDEPTPNDNEPDWADEPDDLTVDYTPEGAKR